MYFSFQMSGRVTRSLLSICQNSAPTLWRNYVSWGPPLSSFRSYFLCSMHSFLAGFHTEGGRGQPRSQAPLSQWTVDGNAGHVCPPPPEILKWSMVIIVLSQLLNNNLVPDCIRSNLRGSKFLGWGGGNMPPDPSSRHPSFCVHECAFTCYYHPATILFPPLTCTSCLHEKR